MSGWIWMIRRFGFVTAFLWWRDGRRRGWMSKDQSDEFLRRYREVIRR